MDITTNDFKLTEKQWFWVQMRYFFRRHWLWLSINILLIPILFIISQDAIGYIFICILVFFALYSVFRIWQYVYSEDNKVIYKRRYFVFQDDFIKGILEDGSYDQIDWQDVIKVISFPRYYVIFLSENQFIPVDRSSFKSEADIQEFESFLKGESLL